MAKREPGPSNKQVEIFVNRFERWLDKSLGRIIANLEAANATTQLTAEEQLATIGSIGQQLSAMGLDDELERLDVLYGIQLRDAKAQLADMGIRTFGGASREVIENIMTMEDFLLKSSVSSDVIDLQAVITRQLFGAEKLDTQDLTTVWGSKIAAHVQTEVSTGLTGFHNKVTSEAAKETGRDLAVYLGAPIDNRMRDFCKVRVDKVFTRAEIELMNNDQGLPVLLYGGGYNCRHHWRWLTPEEAGRLYGHKV